MSKKFEFFDKVTSKASDVSCLNGESVMPSGRRPSPLFAFSTEHRICTSCVKSPLDDVFQDVMSWK